MFKKLSVVIPAYNEEVNIGRCLDALLSMDAMSMEVEIIVVDNGSKDRTVAIAKNYTANIMVNKEANISGLRNLGVAHAKGDLLGFVDADCIVSKEWLAKAVECLHTQGADAVGSVYTIPAESGWIAETMELIQRKKKGADPQYIPSGNLIIKRVVFETVGGFDESLETNEDVEICHRLKMKGYKLFGCPEIVSTHLGTPKTIKEMFQKEAWHGKNSWTVFCRELKKVKNLTIVLYSSWNLILLIVCCYGVLHYCLYKKIVIFVVGMLLYFVTNFIVTMRDWIKIQRNMLGLYCHTVIFGLARSFSFFKWVASWNRVKKTQK